MSVSRIPKNTVVKIDGEGTGVVKSSKFEIDETIYDVEIEGIDICLPFSQYRLEIVYRQKSRRWQVHLHVSNQLGLQI